MQLYTRQQLDPLISLTYRSLTSRMRHLITTVDDLLFRDRFLNPRRGSSPVKPTHSPLPPNPDLPPGNLQKAHPPKL